MSNRHPHEEAAVAALMDHLRAIGRGEFRVRGEHVPAANSKNCDYLLESLKRPAETVAVEIVRVVDAEEELKARFRQHAHWGALKSALIDAGVGGAWVKIPWNIDATPRESKQAAGPLAGKIKQALDSAAEGARVSVAGHVATRFAEFKTPVFSTSSGAHYVNTTAHAQHLFETFVKKDVQLNLPASERILLAVAWETSLGADDIISRLGIRNDLSRITHADLAFFVARNQAPVLVFSRALRDYFERGSDLPTSEAEALLARKWFAARLNGNVEGTFDRLRETARARQDSLDFLDRESKEALAFHGSKLVEGGRLDDGFWIFRKLLADPDPDGEANLDSDAITTVRGQNAWLGHVIAAHTPASLIPELVAAASTIACDGNKYIRQMAHHLFRVLMTRRDRKGPDGVLLSSEAREEIRIAWRRFVERCIEDGLADAAAVTTDFTFDLDESEVRWFLGAFVGSAGHDGLGHLARVGLYFGYLRESDTSFAAGFDGSRVREVVVELSDSNREFRSALARLVLQSMKDDPAVRAPLAALMPLLYRDDSDEPTLNCAMEAGALLAMSNLLDDAIESHVLEWIQRAETGPGHVGAYVAYLLREICEGFVAVGQGERADRWRGQLADPELRRIALNDRCVGS